MKKYIVKYSFDGEGEVLIKANSPKEAEDKFHDGDYRPEDEAEGGQNYEVVKVTEGV